MQHEETLKKLQQPTMALIGSFYPMSEELQADFVKMVAIYEKNPTADNAKAISDKIMSRDSAADKKAWLAEQAADISPIKRAQLHKKHIEEKQPVPKGILASGMFMTGMDVVSRGEKNALMDAQAAARILALTMEKANDNCPKDAFVDNCSDFSKDAAQKATEMMAKPFMTEIQRVEHLLKLMSSKYSAENEIYSSHDYNGPWETYQYTFGGHPFITKAHNTAVVTLTKSAEVLKNTNPKAAEDIEALAQEIKQNEWPRDKQSTLTMQDYQDLKKSFENDTVCGDYIKATVDQIVTAQQARVKVAEQARTAAR